ncbi:histidine triad (HIT) family protein [Acetomicrobium thermoterrenum DSM 13490]|uniref:Histidine triad (HIT) family protein n=1 Tax=Acetomicrobium thermoterrenum DSM 13490 TaxID=1120987 RepID=A0A1H3GUR7_9BACT|nr:histidine triad nucleotide-binding protein [Acetomicrobium thermoterrenum]SDY07056.1 histidine triad (HIT) family protein [Acetomicrobium thermoterrenum DSM 13490]
MAGECVFCKIARGEMKSDVVYETADVMAIRDIAPQAPHHYLVIPKMHIPTSQDVSDPTLWANLMDAITSVASMMGLSELGYRVVINCGSQACQSIFHLHLHLLSGRKFGWPPG